MILIQKIEKYMKAVPWATLTECSKHLNKSPQSIMGACDRSLISFTRLKRKVIMELWQENLVLKEREKSQ